MASGVPVVAADAGGIPDLVRHEEHGLLFDPEGPCARGAAGDAVAQLLESRGLRAQLARMGRKTAENCTWPLETRRLLASYEEAIQRASRSVVGSVRRALVA